jgi:hypothetical protein
MQALAIRRIDPELKQVVREASRALALLDADRLEELACACRALRCDSLDKLELRRQAREAAGEMAVLARVLDATRANLQVMSRLRDLREGRTSYAEIDGVRVEEAADGND